MPVKIVLGSQSPRRAALLESLGLHFRKISSSIDESYPQELKGSDIAIYIAEAKANSLLNEIREDELLICSDTIVCVDDIVLGKPANREEAIAMLQSLSGRSHEVISALCFCNRNKKVKVYDKTKVFFKKLGIKEIEYYVDKFQPFDKAGAYGIQEWIGMIGIEKIEGSYFTVMGLPTHLILEQIESW